MASPRDIFLQLVHGVCERRWDELPELYAERTHVTHPFHPLGVPALESREELRRHFGAGRSTGGRPTSGSTRPPTRR